VNGGADKQLPSVRGLQPRLTPNNRGDRRVGVPGDGIALVVMGPVNRPLISRKAGV
jgi:hypothetical protein